MKNDLSRRRTRSSYTPAHFIRLFFELITGIWFAVMGYRIADMTCYYMRPAAGDSWKGEDIFLGVCGFVLASIPCMIAYAFAYTWWHFVISPFILTG